MSAPSPSPTPKPVPGFEALSNQIYVQRPAPDAPVGGATDPTTVLLYGWGDGLAKHVVKYTAGFRVLYPRARIIMVLSPLSEAIRRSLEHKADNMLPVVDEIFSGGAKVDPDERLLVEVMSNTGGLFFAATLKAYEHRFGPGAHMPHALLLCDSTPGGVVFRDNVGRWARAMAMGLAPALPWPSALTRALCYLFFWGNHLYELAIGREGAGSYASRSINDPRREPLTAARAYFYSKEDDLIPWYDIEEHAAEARSKGYHVTAEIFEGSPHVGHMRLHPEQYWGAVSRVWNEALALQEAGDKSE
ncbi:uncharacterized protein E0L32_012012 [Thyridium curvatum]|uniref:Uncharacterized protein n=1 Tax=Thyridium curvatum TaxID=1093900 RepID=A0A507B3K3_9PEZI|nr:uncharacterized protein E0L32_012012 [Thyridium curvatum]TPX17685.1 hypothetical protein E0L32_012012 [Thyridium curvatum]